MYFDMSVQEKESERRTACKEERIPLKKRSFVRFILIPICMSFLFIYSYGMSYYTGLQWMQRYISMELFPNATVNSSAKDGCKETNHSDPNYIMFQKVESETASWQTYYFLALTIPAFMASSILPSYSDTYGRRFLMITGVSGVFIKACIFVAIVHYRLHLIFVVICSVIEGVSGSFYTVSAASYSYIADITSSGRQRTIGITIFDAIMMLSSTVAGPTTGLLLQRAGYFTTVIITAALSAVTLLLLIILVPESHEKQFRSNTVSIPKVIRKTVDFYSNPEFKGKRVAYLLLIFAYLFEKLTTVHRSAIEMLYQMGMPFCWSSEKLGYFAAARHGGLGLTELLFIVPLKRCLSDLQIAILSTVSNAGSFVLEALARTDVTLYLVTVVSMFSYLTVPMLKSIMSSMTSPDKQGSLFASVEAMQCVSGIIASFLFNSIYSATIYIMNGFMFLVLAAIAILVFAILMVFSFTQRRHNTVDAAEEKHVS